MFLVWFRVEIRVSWAVEYTLSFNRIPNMHTNGFRLTNFWKFVKSLLFLSKCIKQIELFINLSVFLKIDFLKNFFDKVL